MLLSYNILAITRILNIKIEIYLRSTIHKSLVFSICAHVQFIIYRCTIHLVSIFSMLVRQLPSHWTVPFYFWQPLVAFVSNCMEPEAQVPQTLTMLVEERFQPLHMYPRTQMALMASLYSYSTHRMNMQSCGVPLQEATGTPLPKCHHSINHV